MIPTILVKAAPAWSKRPTNADYARLQNLTDSDLRALALLIRENGPEEWYVRFANILLERHKDSWVLGRRLAGDDSPEDVYDELVGRAKADQESEWLLRFFEDLQSGRYTADDGSLRLAQVQARSSMYAGKLRGTANEAFIQTSADDESFDWRLSGAEEHCSDCPTLAGMSPWRKDELGTWPGEGGTPCLTRCLCRIVRVSDGQSGFRPVLAA